MTPKLKLSCVYATTQAFIRVIWYSPNSIRIISKCKYKFAVKKSRSVAQWADQEAEIISYFCPSLVADFKSASLILWRFSKEMSSEIKK